MKQLGIITAFMLAALVGSCAIHPAAAQDSHSEFWQAEAARQAAQHTPAPRRAVSERRRAGNRHVRAIGAESSHPLLRVAGAYMGRRNPTGQRGNWCRWFVNHVIRKAGYPLADTSGLARNATRLGARVRNPQPGDLVVMRSHVTIFKAWTSDGRIVGRGGNQCRRIVCDSVYQPRRVIAYVRVGSSRFAMNGEM